MQRRVFSGDDLVGVSLPDETRSILPPEPMPGLHDYEGAVLRALRSPLGSPPLADLVRPGNRVTIAFDDPCLPLPPMAGDVRGRAIEVILEELFRAGVEKERIRLVCAIGLHRKWTPAELHHLLGRKVCREIGPSRIFNHDAEDPDGIVELGRSRSGHLVQVSRSVTESDLVIYVNVNWTPMNGGWKSILVGLGTFESIRTHHNVGVLEQGTLMDPDRNHYHGMMEEMGDVVAQQANIFTVETVVNNRVWGPGIDRLLSVTGNGSNGPVPRAMRCAGRLPEVVKQNLAGSLRSGYEPIAVHAGRINDVHPATLATLARQQNTTVRGQTDALFLGLVVEARSAERASVALTERPPGVGQHRVGGGRIGAEPARQPWVVQDPVVHAPPVPAPRRGGDELGAELVGAGEEARDDVDPRGAVELESVRRRARRHRGRSHREQRALPLHHPASLDEQAYDVLLEGGRSRDLTGWCRGSDP